MESRAARRREKNAWGAGWAVWPRPGLPVALALLGALLLLSLQSASGAAQTATGNAGLVINFGNGQVRTYCFTVSPNGVPALELLQRTGLALRLDYVSLGAEICAINGTGCLDPGQPCYCQCQGTPCVFWQLFEWRNGRWVASNLGASGLIAWPGSIEGWSWGGTPPPPSGDALCALAAPPTATAPPAPTHTPRPPPTRTPLPPPTHTPRPLPTATPPPRATASPAPAVAIAAPVPSNTPLSPPSATQSPPVVPTDTPPPAPVPTETVAPAPSPTATLLPAIPPTETAVPIPTLSATPAPNPPPASAAAPPASYWFLGVLVLALLGLIGWARIGRRAG